MSRDRRSDDELIRIADDLAMMVESAGWRYVVEMATEKRRAALEALSQADPANVGQIARLQAQAHESQVIPRLVTEAIRRGQQARERAARRRGGDD